MNPLNQFRAQDIAAQIQQRRWEIQQQQRNDAANQNAATVFRNANPLGLDAASLEAAATGISQGRYDPSTWVTATTGLAKQRAAQAASDAVSSDPEVQNYSPAERASVTSLVLNGTSLADAKSQVFNERLTGAKTGAALGAGDAAASAASQPGMTPELGPLARTLALNDPSKVEPLIAGGRARVAGADMPATTSRFDPSVTTLTTDQSLGGVTPTLPAQLEPQKISGDIAADVAKRSMGPGAADQPIRGGTFDPVTNTFTPAPAATPGAPPTPPAPGPTGTVTVAPAPPDTAATAASAAAQTGAQTVAKARNEDVQSDIDTMKSSQSLLRNLATLRQYSYLLPNDDVIDQGLATAMNKAFGDLGVTITAGQSATNVFKAISSQMVADARKDMGIQRLAAPEIQALAQMLPNPRMDPQALTAVLDNFETKARLGIEVGKLARETMGKGSDAGVSQRDYVDYTNKRADLLAPPTQDKPPGSSAPASTQPQPPSAPKPPDLKMGPNGGWLHLQPDGSYR